MNTTSKLIGSFQGQSKSALADALGNLIKSTYITNVTWDSSTSTLSFWSGSVLKYSCVVELGIQDDPTKPLYFLSKQNGSTLRLDNNGLGGTYQTSTDNVTWSDYTFGTDIVLNSGEGIYFRIKTARSTGGGSNKCVKFRVSNGIIEAYNNVLSLINPTNFSNITSSTLTGIFFALFEVVSPYVSIYRAPLLPLTTIGNYAYDKMFYRCTNLSKAPELPATTLGIDCYNSMFYGCTSLTQAPELPATTPKDACYSYMFKGCTSLTKSPNLPMLFSSSASTSIYYKEMFSYCSNLKEVRIASTSNVKNYNLTDWLLNVYPTGDFYCVPGVSFNSGSSGIPSGWTRRDINDYPSA